MSERSTCWSITINNPTEDEYLIPLPVGWKIEGQLEVGDSGTQHYQGMLRTPQVRFSAVKKIFPRAHIEVARNPIALKQYVHKEETRVAEVDRIPTLFEYETIIAKMWNEEEFQVRWQTAIRLESIPDINLVAMKYIDSLVAADIENGRRGAEFIAINPMWRSAWIKFWRSIIKRNASSQSRDSRPAACSEGSDVSSSSCSPACEGSAQCV